MVDIGIILAISMHLCYLYFNYTNTKGENYITSNSEYQKHETDQGRQVSRKCFYKAIYKNCIFFLHYHPYGNKAS
jgi:hypothetical protein